MRNGRLGKLAVATGVALATLGLASPALAAPGDAPATTSKIGIGMVHPNFMNKKAADVQTRDCDGIATAATAGYDHWTFDTTTNVKYKYFAAYLYKSDNPASLTVAAFKVDAADPAKAVKPMTIKEQLQFVKELTKDLGPEYKQLLEKQLEAYKGQELELPDAKADFGAKGDRVRLVTPGGWKLLSGFAITDGELPLAEMINVTGTCLATAVPAKPAGKPSSAAATKGGGTLPVTGANVTMLVVGGVALVGLGGALMLVRRRSA